MIWPRYQRYIGVHLAHSLLLVAGGLSGIVWLSQALRLMDFIVNQGVSFGLFLELTLLLLPSLVILILPIALMISAVFVYHKLWIDSEIVAMEAAGITRLQLLAPLAKVGLLVAAAGILLNCYFVPLSYTKYRDLQFFARNHYVSLLLQEGVFATPVEGLTVFVRNRDADGGLHGILVHDAREHSGKHAHGEKRANDYPTSVTMMAQEGRLHETPQGPQFELISGNRQEWNDGRISFLNFARYTLDVSLYNTPSRERNEELQEDTLSGLMHRQEIATPEELPRIRGEIHQRILWPLYSLTIPMIAVSLLLSGAFNRRGQWKRITLAVMCGVAVLLGALALRALMAKAMVWIMLGYALALLPIMIALWLALPPPLRLAVKGAS